MKRTAILFFLALGLMSTKRIEAQMAAAKTITWDVEVTVDVNISKGDVWSVLIDNEKLQAYSNGYVVSIKKIDQELVESREIIFANGNKRNETFAQKDYVNKFMVIGIDRPSLPKGIKNAQIAIFTKDIDDENSNILWVAKIEGKKSRKKKFKDQLTEEFNAYVKGFSGIKG